MSYLNTGKVWSPAEFPKYLANQRKPEWARGVCLHHCSAPSLAQRPDGFKAQHLENLRGFYRDTKGWSAGPHAFTDEDQIWGLTPFQEKGTHAVSFNRSHLGIEVLGDYDSENPLQGRGLACWQTTFAATKALLDWLGLPVNEQTVKFHRDDPKTSKTCPGTKVTKKWVLEQLLAVAPAEPTVVAPTKALGAVAPVVGYMVQEKGWAYGDAVKALRRTGNQFLFNGVWLEDAVYDLRQGATVAPVADLAALPARVG